MKELSDKIIIFVAQIFTIMKRISLIISLVALFALNVNAQQGSNQFGLKIGPNFNWANSTTSAGKGNGAQLGLSMGAFVDHYFTSHMALSVGLNFNLTRMKYQFTDNREMPGFIVPYNVTVDRKFKGSSLEVPVKLKAKFNIVDSWNAFAEAGAGIGLNLASKGKDSYEFYGTSFTDEQFVDCSSEYRRLQAALHFGIGAEYELSSKMNVFAQLTFRHALSNMFTRALFLQTDSNLKANYIGLEVGILL